MIATSNKRDIVDVTRPIRSEAGQVWVSDPQAVAEEESSWWWNPLSYVMNEATAGNMASHFAAGSREPGTKPDAYFDPAGQNLLKALLLAAALNAAPITQVYTWLTRPHDEAPADLLRGAGFDLLADMVIGHIREPEKQRAGVYGTARQMVSCLTDRDVSQWVTPHRAPPWTRTRGRSSSPKSSSAGKAPSIASPAKASAPQALSSRP